MKLEESSLLKKFKKHFKDNSKWERGNKMSADMNNCQAGAGGKES